MQKKLSNTEADAWESTLSKLRRNWQWMESVAAGLEGKRPIAREVCSFRDTRVGPERDLLRNTGDKCVCSEAEGLELHRYPLQSSRVCTHCPCCSLHEWGGGMCPRTNGVQSTCRRMFDIRATIYALSGYECVCIVCLCVCEGEGPKGEHDVSAVALFGGLSYARCCLITVHVSMSLHNMHILLLWTE
jgi:hypothetical protein